MAHQLINPSTGALFHDQDTGNNYDVGSIIHRMTTRLNLEDGQSLVQANNVTDKADFETINFYCDLFSKKGSTMEFTIENMYEHNFKGAPGIKNPKDLKVFLCKFPQIFNINDDKVSLKNPALLYDRRVDWIIKLLKDDHPEISKSVINAIQFYSDTMYQLKLTTLFPISQLVTHRNKAKEDVQIIATNPIELKSFLMAYPKIFNVKGDKVNLTDGALFHKKDNTWLKDLILDGSCKSTKGLSSKKAVEYFINILLKKDKVPILELYDFSSNASKDIKVITKSFEEFVVFLSNHSEIFTIKNGNVMLNHGVSQQLINDKSVTMEETSKILALKTKFNEENLLVGHIKKALEVSCLKELPLSQLMEICGTEDENCLKTMLLKNPDIFMNRGDLVSLRENYDMTTDSSIEKPAVNIKRKKPKTYIQIINYLMNLLIEQVGINVNFSLEHLFLLINSAPPKIQQSLKTEEDLRLIISQHPNIFEVTEKSILLKGTHNDIIALLFFVQIIKEKVGVGTQFPIARLKLNVDPVHEIIRDYIQLKKFFCKFPNIFNVDFNTVTLKEFKFINSLNDDKYPKKYESFAKLYFDETNSIKEGIDFYSRVIKRFCFNLEVTISHLWGYRCLAPIEVFALTKDKGELKQFLSSYPDIFNIQEDKVSLLQLSNCKESHSEPTDNKVKIAIEFYKSILNRVSYNCECPIVILFGYQHSAPLEVKEMIKTPLDLKDFLIEHPSVFSVVNDVVIHRNGGSTCNNQLVDFNEQNTLLHKTTSSCSISAQLDNGSSDSELKSKRNAVIRAIRFYAYVMFKKGPNSDHLITNLIAHRGEGTNEVKAIAKKPIELLSFLSMFPEIFSVDTTKLTAKLANMVAVYQNQRTWIKDVLPKYHHSTTNHEAVVSGIQFYSNVICDKSLSFSLTIKTLFSHRKTAMEVVQLLAKNQLELMEFLSLFPEIFTFNNDLVSLTNAAVSKILQPQWIECVVHDDLIQNFPFDVKSTTEACKVNSSKKTNITSATHNCNIKEDIKAVNFFKSVLETFGEGAKVPLEKMISYRSSGSQYVKELINKPVELKDFFKKYPNVFTVKKQYVMLNHSKKEIDITAKRQNLHTLESTDSQLPQNNFDNDKAKSAGNSQMDGKVTCVQDMNDQSSNIINSILFYINLICRKGPKLEHPINKLYCHQTQASNDIKETIKNEKELKKFFSKFPQLFFVNHQKHTVTIESSFELQKHQESWIKEILPKHQSTTNEAFVSAIQFFSNIILEKSPECGMLVPYLHSHRTTATEEVKALTINIMELSSFLSKFPDIFVVIDNAVSLTNLAKLHKTRPKWIERLVCSDETSTLVIETQMKTPPEIKKKGKESLKKKKNAVICRAIQFYHNIMMDGNDGFSLIQLFDCLKKAPGDVKEIAKNSTELKIFFSKYPHIFHVNDNIISLDKKVSPKSRKPL